MGSRGCGAFGCCVGLAEGLQIPPFRILAAKPKQDVTVTGMVFGPKALDHGVYEALGVVSSVLVLSSKTVRSGSRGIVRCP